MSKLPVDATVPEIAEAIRRKQARCKVGKISAPVEVAQRVRSRLDLANKMADALGHELRVLNPEGIFYDKAAYYDSAMTYVHVKYTPTLRFDSEVDICIYRGRPSGHVMEGKLRLEIPKEM